MNPMQSLKLLTWAGCATRWAFVAVSLTSGLLVMAQEPDTSSQTNDVMATEALSRLNDLVQGADSAQPEDMAPANDLSSTNNIDQPGTPASSANGTPRVNRFDAAGRTDSNSRSQSASDRRSRGRRRSRSDQSGGFGSASDSSQGSGGTNNGPITVDYSSFKVVVDKNIFDPNRQPQRGPRTVQRVPNRVDSLTLVGTMTYEKGTFAFFDGTSAEYKKALKLADAIAGYKVTNIAPTGVKLASGTNVMDLIVGAQLRREEDGPWQLSSQSSSYAATPASTSTNATPSTSTGSDPASGSAESDIIKRLMQKREKE
jgi:hypothetical protein